MPSRLNVFVQMDPISRIKLATDTTFALLLEAQRRGHRLFYYEPKDLAWDNGKVYAYASPLQVKDKEGDHYQLGTRTKTPLDKADVILMRQDPPFDMSYITACDLLERVPRRTLIVNDPRGVRMSSEKMFAAEFPDLMAPTLITRDAEAIAEFRARHKDIVVKPLYGFGGQGVFRLRAHDPNMLSLQELFAKLLGAEPLMVQKYLPAVTKGDRRVLLFDGEPVAVINRRPRKGMVRANMASGGMPEAVPVDTTDRRIAARLAPALRERGLLLTGIDIIGGKLTEINVTSPTGIRAYNRLTGEKIDRQLWQLIERKLADRRAKAGLHP